LIRSKAYLFKGVKIIWKCDANLIKDDTPQSEILHFPNGIKDFLESELKGIKTITNDLLNGQSVGYTPTMIILPQAIATQSPHQWAAHTNRVCGLPLQRQ
jgi:DNA gyrase/topoisomerase IV subunit B